MIVQSFNKLNRRERGRVAQVFRAAVLKEIK